MTHIIAVHLDLRDVQSARVWGWIRALGLQEQVEARPFSLDVADPWDCEAPSFGLELLMLMEQARDHGPAAVARLVDTAFARIGVDAEAAHAELAMWLQVGAAAGLPLAEYDEEMERLKAEVGYWMEEAREDHGVIRPPTLLFDDGTTAYVQLDAPVEDPEDAQRFLAVVLERLAAIDGADKGA